MHGVCGVLCDGFGFPSNCLSAEVCEWGLGGSNYFAGMSYYLGEFDFMFSGQ